jgi:hypothetical protein
MSATVLSLAHESESRAWDRVVEADLLMTQDQLRRAQAIAAAWAAARAEGRGDFVSCELAAALNVDDLTARAMIAEAQLLTELPPLAEAMERGTVRLPHAQVLTHELMCLETRLALDVLAVVLPKVAGRTPAQLRGIVRRAVIKVDADAAAKRRRDEVRRRRVFVSPEPDGMALFGSYLTAGNAMEAYRLVDAHAKTLPKDDRCADERRADALMELLRGGGADAPSVVPRNVDVMVPVSVALGFADEPCDLPGYGPIDAEAARELITDAVLRKVCVDAKTGVVLAVESKTRRVRGPQQLREELLDMVHTPTAYDDDYVLGYRPTAAQRRLVDRRDRTCTFPSCSMPAHRSDADHRRPWRKGRYTTAAGLGALSRKHHRAKQTGWTPSPMPDGSVLWNSPSGRTYIRPPAHDPPEPIDPDATLPPHTAARPSCTAATACHAALCADTSTHCIRRP